MRVMRDFARGGEIFFMRVRRIFSRGKGRFPVHKKTAVNIPPLHLVGPFGALDGHPDIAPVLELSQHLLDPPLG